MNCNLDGECKQCNSNYFLNDKFVCNFCSIQNCDLCDSTGKCSKCKSGYFIDPNTSQCIKCDTFDSECLTCIGDKQCTLCSDVSYLESSNFLNKNILCRKCDTGTYVSGKSCQFCSDFGRCTECNKSGCEICTTNSVMDNYNNCNCKTGYFGVGTECLSILIIILPLIVLFIVFLITTYCLVNKKIRNNLIRNLNIINQQNNNQNNLQENRNLNIQNPRVRIAPENRILKPLVEHDSIHGVECIFGDLNPPFWEFDCGGFMCNPCSLRLVTDFSVDKESCIKCTNKYTNFKFVNRFMDNDDLININGTSLIKIENINNDSKNSSVNESQNDAICKICFVLKNSKQIKCDSNTQHMLCSYCYNRLINIEEISKCPFCRSEIHP